MRFKRGDIIFNGWRQTVLVLGEGDEDETLHVRHISGDYTGDETRGYCPDGCVKVGHRDPLSGIKEIPRFNFK